MSFIDKSWFWLLTAAVIYAILFLLSYLNSDFSTLSILLLIVTIGLLVITLMTGISTKIKNDFLKSKQLFQQKITGDVNATEKFLKGTFEGLASVGQATVEIGGQLGEGIAIQADTGVKAFVGMKGAEKQYVKMRKVDKA